METPEQLLRVLTLVVAVCDQALHELQAADLPLRERLAPALTDTRNAAAAFLTANRRPAHQPPAPRRGTSAD
jgi:hypothetical protein